MANISDVNVSLIVIKVTANVWGLANWLNPKLNRITNVDNGTTAQTDAKE